jgi:hypothetical protein
MAEQGQIPSPNRIDAESAFCPAVHNARPPRLDVIGWRYLGSATSFMDHQFYSGVSIAN